MFGALTLAEVGSRYPAAGGFYKIFSHCYHPAFAFTVNWISIIANAGSSASVAMMGAGYICPLLFPDLEPVLATRITTISVVLALYGINLLGIKMGARNLNVLLVIKIGMLVLLISIIFLPHPGPGKPCCRRFPAARCRHSGCGSCRSFSPTAAITRQ